MKIGFVIIVPLILATLGGGYLKVFMPAEKWRISRRADMDSKNKMLSDLRLATADVPNMERKLDELQERIKFFESRLPQEREVDSVLREIWQLADKHSLNTKTIKTLKSEKLSGYSELPVQIGLSGDFRGFYSFMLDLERLNRITRVSNMKLEKITNHEGEMNATMTLCIYFESGKPATAGKELKK
jgi:type IV pilus assembly protein PilO